MHGIVYYLFRSSLESKEILNGDILKGYVLTDIRFNLGLDNMMKPADAIHMKLDKEKNSKSTKVFVKFTVDMIKTLFLTDDDKAQTAATSYLNICIFYVWYSRNFKLMKDEDKREILRSFDLTKFTEDQLLKVRRYGLFTNA